MLELFRNSRLKMVLLLFLVIISSLDGVVLSSIVNEASEFNRNSLMSDIIFFGIKSFMSWCVVYSSQYLYEVVLASIIREINLEKKQVFFWEEFINYKDNKATSFYISKLTNDFKLFETEYIHSIFGIISNGMMCTVSLLYMLKLNTLISMLFILCSIIPLLSPLAFSKVVKNAAKKWSMSNEEYVKVVKESFNGSFVLKSYGAYREIFTKTFDKLLNLEKSNYSLYKYQALLNLCSSILAGISFIFPFIIGCIYMKNHNSISFGILISIFLLNDRIVGPITNIAECLNKMQTTREIRTDIIRSSKVLNMSPKYPYVSDNVSSLKLDKVKFSNNGNRILDVNCIFSGMFKVLIYGQSGCGKTTLLKLIMGVLEPDSGKISVLNVKNKKLPIISSVGYIAQKPYIFDASVYENISLFKKVYTRRDVNNVMKIVGLDSELDIDYMCGEDGNNLSAGQIQRIEIARALLQGKKLLLADEITANLDKRNERNIRNMLFSLPIPVIEVAHHFDNSEGRYTYKYELKDGILKEG